MSGFKLSLKARADLKTIALFTQEKWGVAQRRRYLRQIDDAFHLLSRSPEIAVACDYIKTGYRKHSVVSHVIFFRILPSSEILIVRVLHKRMDVQLVLD